MPFGPVFGIDLGTIMIVEIPQILIIFLLIMFLVRYYMYGKEGFIFAKARRKNLPVLSIVEIGSNHADFVLGVKEKADSVEFKNDRQGTQVDPTLTTAGAEPERHPFGLNILHYSYVDWLSIGAKNALAYQTIVRYRQENGNRLPFLKILTDVEFTTLISSPKMHLPHDIKPYMSKYNPEKPEPVYIDGQPFIEEYTADELIEQIDIAREDINRLPIIPGFFSYHQAFENIPSGYTAQNLEQLIILIKKMLFEDWLKKFNMVIYGVIIIGIIMAGAVAIYILSMVARGG